MSGIMWRGLCTLGLHWWIAEKMWAEILFFFLFTFPVVPARQLIYLYVLDSSNFLMKVKTKLLFFCCCFFFFLLNGLVFSQDTQSLASGMFLAFFIVVFAIWHLFITQLFSWLYKVLDFYRWYEQSYQSKFNITMGTYIGRILCCWKIIVAMLIFFINVAVYTLINIKTWCFSLLYLLEFWDCWLVNNFALVILHFLYCFDLMTTSQISQSEIINRAFII